MKIVFSTLTTRYVSLIIPALFLLGVLMPVMQQYGLNFDEVFSVTLSQHFSSIVDMVRTQENNMLLHYLLLWLWIPLGDGSEAFLRLPSVILTLLALIPLHAAARRVSTETVANTCCFVFVSHFLILNHAITCRGYALAVLINTLVFWSWARAWQTQKTKHWLFTGLLAGLSIWAHYFCALLPPILIIAMLWRDGLKQPWKNILLALVAFILVALPIVLTRPAAGAEQISWIAPPDLRAVRTTLWMVLGSNGQLERLVLMAIFSLIACMLVLRSKLAFKEGQWRNINIGLTVGLLLIITAVLLESLVWQPLFIYRYFTPIVPVYCVVVAAGLTLLWPWLRMTLLALLLTSSAWEIHKAFTMPIPSHVWWRSMIEQIAPSIKPDDTLLVYPFFLRMPVDYYLERLDHEQRLPRPTEYAAGYYRPGGGQDPDPDWQTLQKISRSAHGRIWLIAHEDTLPSTRTLNRAHAPAIRKQLSTTRRQVYELRYSNLTVQAFEVPPTH